MKLVWRRTILAVVGTAAVLLLGMTFAAGQGAQTTPPQKQLMAEDVHKNIQVLKGVPENEFMETMGFFCASLGVSCEYCHDLGNGNSWDAYAIDNGHKRTARRMIQMVQTINRTDFGGRRALTCYSCHRGGESPKLIPNVNDLYTPPPPEDPDTISSQAAGAPSADQVLNKYIQALGGASRLAALTSVVARGTYEGYSESEQGTAEIFAKAPAQRSIVFHTGSGDTTTTYNAGVGWIAAPQNLAPVQVLALTGGDLDGARVDTELMFPAHIRQTLTKWRGSYPVTVGDRDLDVIQGTSPGNSPVKLYFDPKSNLLVRLVRYTDSPVGLNPTQTDFDDYRDVAGVKIPFHWLISWLDGRSDIHLTDVRANVAIDAARFAKPAPPASGKTATR